MRQVVIYIPGIRDNAYNIQSVLLQLWRFRGVKPVMHPMPWFGSEAYAPKFERLLILIDKYLGMGCQVSLVGASAGASAVINAYVRRREAVTGLVYICGKINRPDSVSNRVCLENPAFKSSLLELQKTLPKLTHADKRRILSIYSPVDMSVPYEDTVIQGVSEWRLPSIGHGWAILYTLIFQSGKLVKHLKSVQV